MCSLTVIPTQNLKRFFETDYRKYVYLNKITLTVALDYLNITGIFKNNIPEPKVFEKYTKNCEVCEYTEKYQSS